MTYYCFIFIPFQNWAAAAQYDGVRASKCQALKLQCTGGNGVTVIALKTLPAEMGTLYSAHAEV